MNNDDDGELQFETIFIAFVISLAVFWLPLIYLAIGYFHAHP
jgi:hypothetical protein